MEMEKLRKRELLKREKDEVQSDVLRDVLFFENASPQLFSQDRNAGCAGESFSHSGLVKRCAITQIEKRKTRRVQWVVRFD
jgi:hypothetical protein